MSSNNNPRILPAPSRPTDSQPATPADSYPAFPTQPGPSKRRVEELIAATTTKKRARVSYSCQECHRRKQKCDRQVPCGHCVARKVPELCKNYQPGKQEDFNARLTRLENIIDLALPQFAGAEYTAPSSPHEPGSALTYPNDWPTNGDRNGMDIDHRLDGPQSPASSRSTSPKPEDFAPAGGMLESGRWYGTSALGSVYSRPILEQLHSDAVPQMMDESSEVNDKLKSLIQECGVSPHKLFEIVQELPPKSLSDVLIDYYFTYVNYTRYPIYEPAFRASYDSVCNNGTRVQPHDIRFLPLLFVVLAIAARLAPEHILGDDRQKRLMSLRYYWSSRQSLLIAVAVQNDSFEIVLTRLLSARFLTFDRRITECWAQLGAAVRTAQALGLHRDPSKMGLEPFITEYRRRVWAYLYHADSTFALLLGRPRTIHDSYCDTLPPSNVEDSEIVQHMRQHAPSSVGPHPPHYPIYPPLPSNPLSTPTHMTYPILRHGLAVIIGHIVHHFQQVKHHPTYNEVLVLDEELMQFVKKLPPHFGLEPDTSLDESHPYIPVHRYLIICEVYFVRISLHRPYILRRLNSDKFGPSRRACIESARKDFEVRQAFKKSMPQTVRGALGGAYREFQSAMISGIALVIDPVGPDAAAMHQVLDSFLSAHGVGEGAPPLIKELDETTRRELKIIQLLSEKAKAEEARRTDVKQHSPGNSQDDSQDGQGGETLASERSSARLKRKKSSRSVTAQDAGLLLGISGATSPVSVAPHASTAPASATSSPFMTSHSRTPSNAMPPSGITNQTQLSLPDLPSSGVITSPTFARLHGASHAISPLSGSQLHLSHLAHRQVGHDARSLASSSSSAEDESAQRLFDNWCYTVNTTEPGNINMSPFDTNPFSMFNSGSAAGPLWGGALTGYGPAIGLGLQPDVNTLFSGPGPMSVANPNVPAEANGLPAEGTDYMVWDALVQQIRGSGGT